MSAAAAALALAAGAQDGHSSVDGVGTDEAGTATWTGLTGATVHGQACDESSRCAARVSIVPKARAARRNRFTQYVHDRRVERGSLLGRHTVRRARGVNTRMEESFIRVDVAAACHGALIHQDLFYGLSRSPKKDR